MKKFKYTAVNKKGETILGELEAKTPEDVASILLESGISPVKIIEKVNIFDSLQPSINKQRIPSKEKVIFLREFSTMISAGLPLDDALEVSAAQTTQKTFKSILNDITKDIRSGSSLATAIGKFPKIFSQIEINLVKAGEVSGKMDTILNRLADDVEKQSVLRGKVRGALSYPFFVLAIAVVVVATITIKLVPAMQSLYAGFGSTTLPLPTEILIGVSYAFTNFYFFIILAVLLIYIAVRYYISTPEGRLVVDSGILRLPIIGELISKYEVVTLIKTYAMLLSSGIPVITSLNLVGESIGNQLYAKAIKECSKEVEKGISLATCLAKYEFIPSILWRSIAIGEETGKTEEILNKIGAYFEEQVNDKINNLTRLLEPIMLVVLGSIVGFIAIAIYLPIYNFSSIVH